MKHSLCFVKTAKTVFAFFSESCAFVPKLLRNIKTIVHISYIHCEYCTNSIHFVRIKVKKIYKAIDLFY